MRHSIKIIGVCAIFVLGGWYYIHNTSEGGKSGKNNKGGSIPVGVTKATAGDIDVYLNGLGNVTPRNTVTVHSRVDGQLMRITFREGQLVKAGDVLAELDARPFQAQLEQAQGQLMRDEALLADAKINFQRYKTLFSQDSIAKQQLDTQESLVKQYEGAVKNDEGQLNNAKTQLDYTRITAPFSGRVGLRQVDPGNIVHAGDTNGLVVVTQLQPITSIFTLPEDNISTVMEQVQHNEKLGAEAWDRDSKVKLATGELTAIDNQVDPTTGTVKFRAEFPNKDNALFPSQFINVRLHVDTKKNVVLLSSAAVQRGSQGTFAYLVKPDKTISVTPITLGVTEGNLVEVKTGLKPDDILVTDGADSLREGASVEIPDPNAKTEKPSGDSHKHKKHSGE